MSLLSSLLSKYQAGKQAYQAPLPKPVRIDYSKYNQTPRVQAAIQQAKPLQKQASRLRTVSNTQRLAAKPILAAPNFARQVVQGTARSGGTAALTATGTRGLDLTNPVSKALYGKNAQGNYRLSGFGEATDIARQELPKYKVSPKLAPFLVAGSIAADIIPSGKASKGLAKKAAQFDYSNVIKHSEDLGSLRDFADLIFDKKLKVGRDLGDTIVTDAKNILQRYGINPNQSDKKLARVSSEIFEAGGKIPQKYRKLLPKRMVAGKPDPIRGELGQFRGSKGTAKTIDPLAQDSRPTLYHGTDASFDVFDKKFLGAASIKQPSTMDKVGFSFTNDKEVAQGFGKNVKEAYVDIKNPYVVDTKGKPFLGQVDKMLKKIIPSIDRSKYDGIILKNTEDVGPSGIPKISDHYIPFSEKQIKIKSQLDPLTQEARKSEEMVTLYHGSNTARGADKIGELNKGTFLTDNPAYAKLYSGDRGASGKGVVYKIEVPASSISKTGKPNEVVLNKAISASNAKKLNYIDLANESANFVPGAKGLDSQRGSINIGEGISGLKDNLGRLKRLVTGKSESSSTLGRTASTEQTLLRNSNPELPGSLPRSLSPKTGQSIVPPSRRTIAKIVSSPTGYNTKRYNVKPEVRKAMDGIIEDVKPQIEQVVGSRLSNKEAITHAYRTEKILNKTVTREQTRAAIAANLKLRQQIAKAAEDGQVTPELVQAMIRDKAAGADIARQLQARSINASPAEKNLLNSVIDSILKTTEDTDAVLKAAKTVDFNDAEQVTAFYRQFIAPRAEDWLTKLRYNSMLSSPTTHIVNAFSNAQGSAIIAPIEKTVAGGIDWLRATVIGGDRTRFAGEGVEYAKGYFKSLGEASQRFTDVITGRALIQNPDVFNIPLTQGGVGRTVENVIDSPMKLLEGTDQFFTALTEGGAKQALTYRVSQGVDVKNVAEQAATEASQRLFRGELHPEGQGALLGAIDNVTDAIFSLRNSKNPVTRTIANFTFPFVKTPMNILKQGIEYSPLGLATLDAADKTAQLAKVAIGTSIATGAAMLVSSDRLTWAEPTSEKEKQLYRASGKIPYALKIGDTWVSYSKLHPAVSFNLALVASVKQSLDNRTLNQSQADGILTGLAKWLHFYADQSYLKNIGEFLKATGGDVEGPARLLAGYPQQVIPFRALLGWVNRILDPVQRMPDPDQGVIDKQFQYLLSQIPGLSGNVPARLGPDGKPIPNDNRLLNAVSPLRTSSTNPQQERQHRVQYGNADRFVQLLNNKYKGQVGEYYQKTIGPMTDKQYSEWEVKVKNGGDPKKEWKMVYGKKIQDAAKRKVTEIAKGNLGPDDKKRAIQAARTQAALMIKELQSI